MKKITTIFTLLLIISIQSLVANDIIKILTYIDVDTDYSKDGVKGMNITYRYNFLSLEEADHNDTILKNANFSIKTTFSENGNDIAVAEGYKSVSNDNGNAEFTTIFTLSEMEASKFDKKIYQFIPYAALNLSEGMHNITVNALLSGTDGTGAFHEQTKGASNISFKKPATKKFTLNIDFIELNEKTSSGNAWDFNLFGTDAPDIGVDVLMGTTSVYKNYVDNNYMYAVGPKSKNISFAISENDKVNILVQDIDIVFHDLVAKWTFTTKDKEYGKEYVYNKASTNIKSCNLNFKIE